VLDTAAGGQAGIRFLEFFAGQIRNLHMRRAYSRAVGEFLTWCAGAGVLSIADVLPLHVATWMEGQTKRTDSAASSVKQHLAAIRHLFDWLVTCQVIASNPTGSVRGPSHIVKSGKTPVLDPTEARQLLDRCLIGHS
jgi:site-specific recombinase XerD